MYEGKKSIAEIPELLAEWDFEKNSALGLTPETATRGKTKKVFWICGKGHSFEARIDHRCSMGAGCPYCAGKRPIIGENDAATLYPHLLCEWDEEKNEGLSLRNFVAGSNKQVWWKCADCGHSWKTAIIHRTTCGTGCPLCARAERGKKRTATAVLEKGSLAEHRPDLTAEWDFEKNTEFSPQQVSVGSNKAVWWRCGVCGFSYRKSIAGRSGGNGCPACAGKKVFVGYNDLGTLFPEIAEEWDSARNRKIPSQVTAGHGAKVWWSCKNCGYGWQAYVYSRTKDATGCPVCAGRVAIPGMNDFTTTHEAIATQWDFEKNGDLVPSTLRPGSNKKVWWLCEKGHSWEASIGERTQGRGCPVCAVGNRAKTRAETILKSRGSLEETNPALSKQWDYVLNKGVSPTEVTGGSDRVVWWVCERGHSWKATISSRSSGRGCPICVKERFTSFPEQALFYYLSQITEAENRVKLHGREIDVFLPTLMTGIEYNGRYYHKDRKEQDREKIEFLQNRGIRMICIQEGEECGSVGDTLYYQYKNDYKNFATVIDKVVELLGFPKMDVDIDRDRQEIYALYVQQEKENSVAGKYPWLIDEWNCEKNGKLTPWHISAGSKKRVWWKCQKCGYEWDAAVYSRKKHGCPVCGGRKKRECEGQESIDGM